MAIDLLGPGAFGAARAAAARPALTPSNVGSDSWAKDCSSPVLADGTEDRAAHMNAILAQLRSLIRAGAVSEDNTDDAMMTRAARSQRPNWIGVAGGSANALTATLAPAPAAWADLVGTPFRLLTTAANSSTTPTLNLNALGAKTLVFADGGALTVNAWGAGVLLEVLYDGTNVRVLAGAGREATRFTNRTIKTTPGAGTFLASFTGLHRISMWGPGGGAGAGETTGAGGGGGGGEYVEDYILLTAGVTYNLNVGAGGAGGAPINGAGGLGSNTTFTHGGGTLTAARGQPGNGANAGGSGAGGTGGGGSTVSANGLSRSGGTGYQGQNTSTAFGGGGGQGGNGGGIGGVPSTGSGNAGSTPGGGGGGSTNSGAGGAGGRGEIVIEW